MNGSHRFRWFTGRIWLLLGTLCSLLVLGVAQTTISLPVHAASIAVSVPSPTRSYYESSTDSQTLNGQGCAAGSGPSGVVVLDFGEPWNQSGTYGTRVFASGFPFVSDSNILKGVESFIQGVVRCDKSSHFITVAIGTSNFGRNVNSAAGGAWGGMVGSADSYITSNNHTNVIGADGAIDAETEWNSYATTFNFVDGYNHGVKNQRWLWDYGDDTPGFWTNEQVWNIAYGAGNERPLPEIYFAADATQDWLAVAEWACSNGKLMKFNGAIAEAVTGTNSPQQAYLDLYNALGANSCTMRDRDSMHNLTVI